MMPDLRQQGERHPSQPPINQQWNNQFSFSPTAQQALSPSTSSQFHQQQQLQQQQQQQLHLQQRQQYLQQQQAQYQYNPSAHQGSPPPGQPHLYSSAYQPLPAASSSSSSTPLRQQQPHLPENSNPQRPNSSSNPPTNQQRPQQVSSLMSIPPPTNLPPLPPPNPKLPILLPPDQLPPWARPYANQPAVLQVLFRDRPPVLHVIGKMMVASGRSHEGIPGFPGSSRQHPGAIPSGVVQQQRVPIGSAGSPPQSTSVDPRPSSSSGRPTSTVPTQLGPIPPDQGFLPPVLPVSSVQTLSSRPSSSQSQLTSQRVASLSAVPHPSASTPTSSSPASAKPIGSSPGPILGPTRSNSTVASDWMASLQNATPGLPVTRVEPLPLNMELKDSTFGGLLPALTEAEIRQIKRWLEKDKTYALACETDKERSRALLDILRARPGGLVPPGWWEGDASSDKRMSIDRSSNRTEGLSVVWPELKRSRKEEGLKRKEIRFTKTQMKTVANEEEHLVPIRIEIDHEPIKFRDTFTWNASDRVVTPEIFAQTLVDDFHLPQLFHSKIVSSINEQLAEYRSVFSLSANVVGSSANPTVKGGNAHNGTLDEESSAWWVGWKERTQSNRRKRGWKQVELSAGPGGDLTNQKEGRPLTAGELSRGPDERQVGFEDMRILIKLDITIGSLNLLDAFEWDANGSDSMIEQFAEVYASDLGLAGEFKTAIAHDIREQAQTYIKSLVLVGHPFDGTPILDDDLRVAFLPSLVNVVRSEDIADASFTPIYRELDPVEMDTMDKEREKELRRKKRQTRGRRGVNLPDRDPKATKRSIPSLGLLDENGNLMPISMAPKMVPVIPPPPVLPSKRAAARLASASIASLAKEDRTSPQPMPSSPPRIQTSPPPSSPPTSARETPTFSAPHYRKDLLSATASNNSVISNNNNNNVNDNISNNKKDYRKKGPGPGTHSKISLKQAGRPSSGRKRQFSSTSSSQSGQTGKSLQQQSASSPHGDFSPDAASPDSLSSLPTSPEFNHLRPTQSELDTLKNKDPVSLSPSPRSLDQPDMALTGRGSERDSETSSIPQPQSIPPPLTSPPPPPQPLRVEEMRPTVSANMNGYVKPLSATRPAPPPPPSWIAIAADSLRKRYPDDNFQIIPKPRKNVLPSTPVTEWRIKCFDCPGKVYDPGVGPELDNFVVHLNNRSHRGNVSARLSALAAGGSV
ncbi:SWI-SNF chromatin remodeling complex, Snf5 subunit [Phaffia rhodozyma]|uniref:SWI-SNF chromatin remodeling complex, Snf5 subunit n=1 Tax=Phaffia rhodozyma TaxID=264483 RepID=A0A0F7SHJ3_PHARH|nr:SWI-SNF chromatin remodeling complex, Snf5 subunit [Phaffia rhodozyma]